MQVMSADEVWSLLNCAMMSNEGDWVVETSKSWRFEKLNSFICVGCRKQIHHQKQRGKIVL